MSKSLRDPVYRFPREQKTTKQKNLFKLKPRFQIEITYNRNYSLLCLCVSPFPFPLCVYVSNFW